MSVILDFFAGIPTSLIALLSLIIAFLAYLFQRNEKRKSRACEVAKYYANSIIPRFRFVAFVFEKIELHIVTDMLKGKMRRFDRSEFTELWGYAKNIEKYLSKITCETLVNASTSSLFDLNTYCTFSDTLAPEDYPLVFDKFVVYLINDLEAMAMLFRYNIADEKLVYQSLHQTLLSRMPLLYHFISRKNYKTDERCFVNLIWLYRKWEKRKIKQKNKVDSLTYGSVIGRKL